MGVAISFVDPASLEGTTVDQLVALANRYLDLDGSWFGERIRDCDRVILYRDQGRVVGCTTLDILDLEHEGRGVRALYTGAVVLDGGVRGRGLLQRAGLGSALRFGLTTTRKVYWFCECDSYRGYRATTGFAESWPRRGPVPADTGLYEALCRRVFGSSWNPATGVCAPIAGRQLKRHVAEVPADCDDDTAYFVERNPGYLRGEALPVLVPLHLPNWVSLGVKMARVPTPHRPAGHVAALR